ncbi:MAG: hypothetical protein EXS63_06450 [Candidatus Omnitrophica bacterium]|nr:hypothetical protein [Candidatus Omnitrophota bacterium]
MMTRWGLAEVNTIVPKTGVFELKEGPNKSVFVFVPQEYNPARTYPLIISFSGEDEKPEAHVKAWASMAERSGVIVMAPSFGLRSGNVVTAYDQWVLGLASGLAHQYHIATHKIFLIGRGERAQYAAYLGVNYPEKFSAVALLNGAWNGPYEKMMTFQKSPRKQIPFYVALKGLDPSIKNEIEQRAVELQKKGYMISLEEVIPEENLGSNDFQKKMYDWLNEKSDIWQDVVQTSKKGWKEKVKLAIEDNIKIEA